MKKMVRALCILVFAATTAQAQTRDTLRSGWRIYSSAHPARAYAATVPSTIVGALVDDGVYKDPFFGMNLRSLPGMSYKIGQNFVHLDMDPSSPYAVPWWYRKSFVLPAAMRGKHVALHFDGINYRANIVLNGRRIADSAQVAGTYRRYEFDVTNLIKQHGTNTLAVEIFAPTPIDLQTTWVDWNPSPPDKDMGLWQDVYLSASGNVTVRDAQVVSVVDTATLKSAQLTVYATLHNLSSRTSTGTVRGSIGAITFSKPLTIAAHDSAVVEFSPDSFPQLRIANPQLWWPAELGKPVLHTLDVAFVSKGVTADRQKVRFGIRQMTSEMTPRGAALFRVNGKRILIRGGGWAPDMFFRPQPARQLAQMKYALDMHLNTIRLEGNYENDRFFQNADSMGILVMTGWVCCLAWEEWKKWGPEQYAVAGYSVRDQMRRLRNHASIVMWLNGSDNPPPADVEQMYLDIEKQERWPNPTVSSASAKPAQFSGHSGVKMTGPYDWVPPSYWLQDTTHGGAWAYNTETSMGAAVPPLESMKKMIPARDLWPLDSVWAYHGAGGQFNQASRFNLAMNARYGEPTSALDYTTKSQLMTYEGERAMFEAYRRNKYVSTGIIQWMMNNAWPSIFWHLFDWYLRPAGGYFGAKIANEPVHALYSYDDNSIAVVSALREPVHNARVQARVLNMDMSEKFARDTTLDIPADSSMRVFTLPAMNGLSSTYFVDLRVRDANGKPISTNFYWLSTHPDLLNLDSTTWYVTPVKQYADFTALSRMPAAHVSRHATFTSQGATVTLSNTGKSIAFFIRAQVKAGANGDEVLPVEWSDNYVTLLPGETRQLTAHYRLRDLHGAKPVLAIRGWNVQ